MGTIRAGDEVHRIGLPWRGVSENAINRCEIVGRFASGLAEEQGTHVLCVGVGESACG